MIRSIYRILLGPWRLSVTRPDSLGIVRDVAVRRSFGVVTVREVLWPWRAKGNPLKRFY